MLNQKGNAAIEMIPLLVIFLVLANFGMGFFGIIHSAILNSIGARNYAFETFRNRANLTYLRDEPATTLPIYYTGTNFRVHATVQEGKSADHWWATQRPIRYTDVNTGVQNPNSSITAHNQTVRTVMTDETKKTSEYFPGTTAQDGDDGVSPVWIMTNYGICLNTTCAG